MLSKEIVDGGSAATVDPPRLYGHDDVIFTQMLTPHDFVCREPVLGYDDEPSETIKSRARSQFSRVLARRL